MPEPRPRTITCFWKRSCGEVGPARLGALCCLPLARETASSGAFDGGRRPAFLGVSSTPRAMSPTRNTRVSTAPSFRAGRRRPTQKGGSRGRRTTKIVALGNALGNRVRFRILPGQVHDMKGGAALITDDSFDALLADKAFDADWLLKDLDARGVRAVIPPKASGKHQRDDDKEICTWRFTSGGPSSRLSSQRSRIS